MTEKINIRARSKEQKEIRMQEIMDAADALFAHSPYHEISLTTIAQALGWSRGNLYKYANTKEEIFLLLYLRKQEGFLNTCSEIPDGLNNDELAAALSHAFHENLDYLKYHNLLSSIFETNSTVEKVADFKLRSFQQREEIYAKIRERFPGFSSHDVRTLYLTIVYHGVGLYGHVSNPEFYRQVYAAAGMSYQQDDFEQMFTDFIRMVFRDAKEKSERKNISVD